jgi:hypothetical protein
VPLPSVQNEAPMGAGESISHSDVTFAQVYLFGRGVGRPVFLKSSVAYDASESRKGPNSWKSPYVLGAPGPPLYHKVMGFCSQSGDMAQM